MKPLLDKYIMIRNECRVRQLRNDNNVHHIQTLGVHRKKCFTYLASKQWNELPSEIQISPSLSIFDTNLKKHM